MASRRLLCSNCFLDRDAAGGVRCPCGAAAAIPLARAGMPSLVVGVVHAGNASGQALSLEHQVGGPRRGGDSFWVESREHRRGSVWLWRAAERDLPRPFDPLGNPPHVAARARALGLTNVLLVARAAGADGSFASNLRLIAERFCPRLDDFLDDFLIVDTDRLLPAVTDVIARWSRSPMAPLAPIEPPRDLFQLADLGGTTAAEFLSHVHAATVAFASWEPGGIIPRATPFPDDDAGGEETPHLARTMKGRGAAFGAFPSRAGLFWGAFHRAREVSPAPDDAIPAWTGWMRGRLGRRRRLCLGRALRSSLPATTLLGLGPDQRTGERRLVEQLEAWSENLPPVVLLEGGSSAPGLARVVRSIFPRAPIFPVDDSHQRPWLRPGALMAPLGAALRMVWS